MKRYSTLAAVALSLAFISQMEGQTVQATPLATRTATEIHRFAAPEARQGIAADERFLYAIDNRAIGKYAKDTGARVAGWQGPADGPIQHLNAGIVRDGLLYATSSNYPELPMIS